MTPAPRLPLRLGIKLPSQVREFPRQAVVTGQLRACRFFRRGIIVMQADLLTFVVSVLTVRALRSGGITRPRRYYDPLRLLTGQRDGYAFPPRPGARPRAGQLSQVPDWSVGTRLPSLPRAARHEHAGSGPWRHGLRHLRQVGRGGLGVSRPCQGFARAQARTFAIGDSQAPSPAHRSRPGARTGLAPGGSSPHRRRPWLHVVSSTSHGRLLSFCKTSQASPDAPKGTKVTKRLTPCAWGIPSWSSCLSW
jgi:hypothetical protein